MASNPKVFLDMTIGSTPASNIVMELFADVAAPFPWLEISGFMC